MQYVQERYFEEAVTPMGSISLKHAKGREQGWDVTMDKDAGVSAFSARLCAKSRVTRAEPEILRIPLNKAPSNPSFSGNSQCDIVCAFPFVTRAVGFERQSVTEWGFEVPGGCHCFSEPSDDVHGAQLSFRMMSHREVPQGWSLCGPCPDPSSRIALCIQTPEPKGNKSRI